MRINSNTSRLGLKLNHSIPFLLILSLFLISGNLWAQKGLIYTPATNGGNKVLDPNADNYVSKTNSGYTVSDIGSVYNEIPYRSFPQFGTEPLGDLVTGSNGGHTDLAEPPLAMYFDGTNMLFRVRLGGNSTASKGYSFFLDTDNKFNNATGTGTPVPYATPSKVINLGFEYEVVFASNFEVKVYKHTGSGDTGDPYTGSVIWTGNVNTYSQRAIAYTTTGSDPDYFYDFYVPLSAFTVNGVPGITATTKLRMTGATITSAQSGLTGTVSDIGGVDDRLYNNDPKKIWVPIIKNFPPTSLGDLNSGEFGCVTSEAPIITSPIKAGATSISGTSLESDGTVIKVYRGTSSTGSTLVSSGTLMGTTTVTSGAWTLSGIAANALAGTTTYVTATATSQSPLKCVSAAATVVQVSANTDCSTVPAPNIDATNSGSANNTKGMNGSYTDPGFSPSGSYPYSVTIEVWQRLPDGTLNGTGFASTSTNPAFPTVNNVATVTITAVNQTATWSIPGKNGVNGPKNGTFVAYAVYSPTSNPCRSAASSNFCSGTTTSISTPVITNQFLLTNSNTATATTLSGTIVGSATAGTLYLGLYKNGFRVSSSAFTSQIAGTVTNAASTLNWTISIPGSTYSTFSAGDILTVRADLQPSGTTLGTVTDYTTCFSSSSNGVKLFGTQTGAPTITGTYCVETAAPGTTVTFTGTATEAGQIIRLYNTNTITATTNSLATSRGTIYSVANPFKSTASDPDFVWAAQLTGITSANTIYAQAQNSSAAPSVLSSVSALTANPSNTNLVFTTNNYTTVISATNPIRTGSGSDGAVYGTFPTNNAIVKVYIDKTLLGTSTVTNGRWSVTGLSQQELYQGGLITATVSTGGCESSFKAPSGINPYSGSPTIAGYDYVLCNTAPSNSATFSVSPTNVCQNATTTVTVASSQIGVYYRVYVNGTARSNYISGTGGTLSITTDALTVSGSRTLTVIASTDFSNGCTTTLNVTGSPATFSQTITVNATASTAPAITGTIGCYNTAATLTITNSNLQAASSGTYQLQKDGVNVIGATAAPNGSANLTIAVPASANLTSGVFTVVFTPTNGCGATSNAITSSIPSISNTVTTSTASICANNTASISVFTQYGGTTPYSYAIYMDPTSGSGTTASPYAGGTLIGTLTGDGTTQTVTTAAFTGTSPYTTNATHRFYVVLTKSGCTATNLSTSVTVAVGATPTTASAGADKTVCPPSTLLEGNSPTSGTGKWTIVSQPSGSNAVIAEDTKYNTTVSGLISGTYTFRWTITGSCSPFASNADDVIITASCATTYAVTAPSYANAFATGSTLASASDSENFNQNATCTNANTTVASSPTTTISNTGSNFQYVTGSSIPANTALDCKTGRIYSTGPVTAGTYTMTIRAKDAAGNFTDVPITMTFYPNASQRSIELLPVELIFFKGAYNKDEVVLTWATASEKDNSHFEVERSVDGKSFVTIGKVQGAGNSVQQIKYSFTDSDPTTGIVYYRLKQVDLNEDFEYSRIIAVNTSDKILSGQLIAYPNPTNGAMQVKFDNAMPEEYTITVFDLVGNKILQKKVKLSSGLNEVKMDLTTLPAGTYIVKAQLLSTQLINRIVKN